MNIYDTKINIEVKAYKLHVCVKELSIEVNIKENKNINMMLTEKWKLKRMIKIKYEVKNYNLTGF